MNPRKSRQVRHLLASQPVRLVVAAAAIALAVPPAVTSMQAAPGAAATSVAAINCPPPSSNVTDPGKGGC